MTLFYADTSALAKRYVVETGSVWVRSWIERSAGNVTAISDLTVVEMLSIFNRRLHDGSLVPQTIPLLEADFLLHVEKEYLIVTIEPAILLEGKRIVKTY